ncbi:hypothetical protein BASA60_006712 [Batrachochytrium salamandrivorans]|nr:hypothetical protein BASA60_006712 [Batrachochytrium salamandrivorans]
MLQESIYAFPSSTALSEALDTLIERLSAQAISQRGAFTIALSGGSLPKILAAKLRDNKTIDFTKWHVLYADERPLSSMPSPYQRHKSSPLSEALAHTPEAAAADYQTKLMDAVKDKTSAGVPRIDAVLLGMGPDGHTCSLFPGHALLDVTDHYVAAIHDSPKPPLTRITLTYPVVNASHNVIFVATGESKANVLHRMVDLNEDFPSARVNPTSGNLYWFLDTAAASQLSVPAKLFKL